jgi:hypothetical protein
MTRFDEDLAPTARLDPRASHHPRGGRFRRLDRPNGTYRNAFQAGDRQPCCVLECPNTVGRGDPQCDSVAACPLGTRRT